MAGYEHSGPVGCDVPFDTANLKGKTAIITGGANGLGEAYVRALVAAGYYIHGTNLAVTDHNLLTSPSERTSVLGTATLKREND